MSRPRLTVSEGPAPALDDWLEHDVATTVPTEKGSAIVPAGGSGPVTLETGSTHSLGGR